MSFFAQHSAAYLSGVKANYGTLGVTGRVKRAECLAANDRTRHTESIAKWAIDAGKSIGLVTTARVTHASPAGNILRLQTNLHEIDVEFSVGLYAHSAERDWECNADVAKSECDASLVEDIAQQLVHGDVGREFKVIFGGGRSKFYNENTENPYGNRGQRTDDRDLIREWLDDGSTMNQRRAYVWNKVSLSIRSVALNSTIKYHFD